MNAEAAVACNVGKDLRGLPIRTSRTSYQARLFLPYSASVCESLGETEKCGLGTQRPWTSQLRV